jgi:hypothetical protein
VSRPPIEHEITALSARAKHTADSYSNRMRGVLAKMGWQDDYRRLFCDPITGELKPEGEKVLADLARHANFGVIDLQASDSELRMNEGRRQLLLHIFGRIDLGSDRLVKLASSIREK